MRNAKEELLRHIAGKEVEFISVAHVDSYKLKKIIKGGILETVSDVIDKLDFNYDSGFGSQELFGFVWFTDGTWLYREEYDGAENWRHAKRPPLNINILEDAYIHA